MADTVRLQREGCDRCGAGALWDVELPSGNHLRFCGHHLNEHIGRFENEGYPIVALQNGQPAHSRPLF